MSGISIGPGLYKLYIMKTGARGSINLDGFKTDVDAVAHLVRSAMVDEDSPSRRKEFIDAVAIAVMHMDDDACDEEDDCDDEEESA